MKVVKKINHNTMQIKFSFKGDSELFYKTLQDVKTLQGRKYTGNRSWNAPIIISNLEKLIKWEFDIDMDILEWYFDKNQKIENEINYDFSSLLDYQIPHVKRLIRNLIRDNAAIDGSDAGIGKTFHAIQIAKYFNLFPVVLTKKTVIPSWERVAKKFGIECFVSNYEQYKNANNKYISFKEKVNKKGNKAKQFKWNTDKNHIVIFDECHVCKNYKTQNSKMLQSIANKESMVLCLSATLAQSPLDMYAVGLTVGLFSNYHEFTKWIFSRGVKQGWFGLEFKDSEENLKKIHNDIFPNKGSRITIKELGDKFPDGKIICDPIQMNEQQEITERYKYLQILAKETRGKFNKDKDNSLTERMRLRQEIELLKIPSIIELVNNLIEEGASVPIFVNFKETIKILSKELGTNCIIDGSITGDARQKNIDDFLNDKERCVLCNMRAGGVGIDLHDIHGKYNRVSVINPSDSATELIQALGRIRRSGGKSKAISRLVFCSGTVEEEIAEKIQKKAQNIEMINDGDLLEFNFNIKEEI